MFEEYLRDPMWAALFAAAVTTGYMMLKNHINNDTSQKPTSYYAKPSALVALLMYFVITQVTSTKEPILTEPF